MMCNKKNFETPDVYACQMSLEPGLNLWQHISKMAQKTQFSSNHNPYVTYSDFHLDQLSRQVTSRIRSAN